MKMYLAVGAAIVLLAWCVTAQAETLYVAPDGNDAWSGRLARPNASRTDGPLASLQGARNAIRQQKAAAAIAKPVQVLIADGQYANTEPLVFAPEDSGTQQCPIVYQAAPDAHPVFSGGRPLTGFQPAGDGNWAVRIPQVTAGDWYFEQLWVNGRRATRARSPNKFYYYVASGVEHGIDPATGQLAQLGNRAFQANPADLQVLKDLTPEQLRDVNVLVYQSWEATRLRVASVDSATATIHFTGTTPWGFNQWGPSQRYHMENYRQALDAPGEWYLDRDGTLLYRPLPGEDMRTASVVAPVLDHFVEFLGAPEAGQWVEHVALQGLAFRHSQYLLPAAGHGDGQAAASIPAVIMADGARHVSLERCEIGHVGIYGIWFRRGCQDCRVVQTYLHDLGAGGVRIGEVSIQPDEKNRTHHIAIDNNIIHSVGRLFPGAIGLWIGQSGYNQVTHNDISDSFYTGVSVGWTWGYGESLANHNTIDFNHLHHLGGGVLSDMGAVYTLGPSPGTTVSSNVVHDVYSYDRYGRGGWGLYNDEGSSQIVLENNLVYNVKTGTYHQHYGRENVVRNNIFAFSMDGQIQRSRVEEHISFIFENNIVIWKDGPLVAAGTLNDERVTMRNNVYWNTAGKPVDFQGQSLAERQQRGLDTGSIVADPKFVDAQELDFHLQPDSPALKLGFKPFDSGQAGVYGDAAWVQLPKSFQFADVEFAPEPPPPPPLSIDDGFEATPAGAAPEKAQLQVENKGDVIAVTDTVAASGRHSLQVIDAPDLQYAFNPHFIYSPNYQDGTARCAFDLRIEDGTVMFHEWRDWSVTPYVVGPSLWVQQGVLQVNGQKLLDVPVGKWIHCELVAGLGSQKTGTWNLTVTLPGQPPQRFENLALGNPDWQHATWVGFISNANAKSQWYVDNLQLGLQGK
ncbi:MAG: right-handed parallel beta-helix repeat-containing protein [Pirellulaceae bacterium]